MLTGARRESVVADSQLPNKKREARVIWEYGESQPEAEGGKGAIMVNIKCEGRLSFQLQCSLCYVVWPGRSIRNIRELKLNSVSAACVGCWDAWVCSPKGPAPLRTLKPTATLRAVPQAPRDPLGPFAA